MPTPSGLVTQQELIDAQLDTAHLGRVVNSKDASGGPISESTNRTGGVNKTLDALETEYLEAIQGAGGESIGTWTVGVTTFTKYNEYAVYNGIPYKPRTSTTLPYVAQGADPTTAPDDASVQPYQEVTEAQVVALATATFPDELPKYTDLVFNSVDDMTNGGSPDGTGETIGGEVVTYGGGMYLTSGDTRWEVVTYTTDFNLGGGLYAQIRSETYVIYVTSTPGGGNLAVYPPLYDTLAGAMASITDNSERKPYRIEMLSGVHDAREILLKDFVDIVRSPLSGSQVIIEHDFLNSESFKNRDIFKTCNTPYDATDNFPIRCKLKGLFIRGVNLNYALHGDFNESPLLDIQADDCIFFNGDDASDASTADYGAGFGVYGRQCYVFNRCLFYGRYDASQTAKNKQQGSGWIVHNRSNQSGPCSISFNDCKSLKGFYGGRVVDYGSGQEDIVSINGGVLRGELGNLLCFSNGLEGTVPPSITVMGDVPITRVAFEQEINAGGTVYKCDFPVVIDGFSEMYIANEDISSGDLITLNVYGTRAIKMLSSLRYKYFIGGVAINPSASGGRVAVQKSGIAAVNFTPSSISSNVPVSNSSTAEGEIQIAVAGDSVLGATIASTSFTTGITPGKAWISLCHSGVKA